MNTVTGIEEGLRHFEVSPCGCGCWFCDRCSLGKGLRLRAELLPILETFGGLVLASLTVDPQLFPSPRAALVYMLERRCVSRTVQDLRRGGYLHSSRYFYVVEWQRRTEQAHFHVLLDASFIPFASLLASWSKHRPPEAGPVMGERPPFGTAWISKPHFQGGPAHAANYVTKYLTKSPDGGFPAWVLAMGRDRLVRRYGTSRGFWGRAPRRRSVGDGQRDIERPTYAERLQECGRTVKVLAVRDMVSEASGETVRERVWVGELDVPGAVLARIDDGESPRRRRRIVHAPSPEHVAGRLSALVGRRASWVRGGPGIAGGCA